MSSRSAAPRRLVGASASAVPVASFVSGALVVLAALALAACGQRSADPAGPLVVYSGRNEAMIAPLVEQFRAAHGVAVEVRYGETAQLAALLLEEGARTPADVFLSQDAGALGALARAGRLAALPQAVLDRVPDPRFRSPDGRWVGTSGRARVLAYDTRALTRAELPTSVRALTEPAWKGRVGWAPTNASFQGFVTAFRLLEGDAAAAAWLRAMKANQPRVYKNNLAIVEALARGEIAVGLVNHYYVHAAAKGRSEPLPVANHHFAKDDPGALINVAGIGVLAGSARPAKAQAFIEFLLGAEAQRHVADETHEYPLVPGAPPPAGLRPIAEVGSPTIDLSRLDALQDTVRLLQREGIL